MWVLGRLKIYILVWFTNNIIFYPSLVLVKPFCEAKKIPELPSYNPTNQFSVFWKGPNFLNFFKKNLVYS